jgi:hypothetical protein
MHFEFVWRVSIQFYVMAEESMELQMEQFRCVWRRCMEMTSVVS